MQYTCTEEIASCFWAAFLGENKWLKHYEKHSNLEGEKPIYWNGNGITSNGVKQQKVAFKTLDVPNSMKDT